MNRRLRLLASWPGYGRSAQRAYRRALIITDLKRVEIGLSYLLWGCVVLISGLVWQEGYHILSGGENGIIRQLPAGLSQPVDAFYPIHAPALGNLATSNKLPSLFTFKPTKPSPVTALSYPAAEAPVEGYATAKPAPKPLRLTLQIQAMPKLQASLKSQLNTAVQQLLSGQLVLAGASFEEVLQQDPHQVIALAGMLVVTSQRGEIQQREDYLSRIRQEIPDYTPEDDLFLMQLEH
ncbi:hypothetical protein [Methylophilus sp. Q8]|uniref:hypothetical protein n=1 Tax=Methylophilus sp. Q8 TaxID=1506586 RepID=UPI001F402F74|nr:hypothetical protein [Methylophilus sp. Q8]